jgi:ribose transport system ATP-binding protein
MTPSLLVLKSITKRFPGVTALSDVSLSVQPREVLGLIGENGAGKSTLMKVLGGVHQADQGEIHFDGKPVAIRHVSDAIALGIGFIHQELNVLENIDVAGNVYLGREPRYGGPLRLLNQSRLRRDAQVFLRRVGLNISPATPMGRLSIAQQQMVEIAKALSQNARLIIMDEPTSSLTLAETDRLFDTVRDLRKSGVSIIYISHRLAEITEICDRVVGLRDGRNAGELSREQITHERMVQLMVGRDLSEMFAAGPAGTPRTGGLTIRNFRTRAHPRHAVELSASRGEILGLAGLVGAGRSELAIAIFGVDPPRGGELILDGQKLTIHSPRDAIAHGIYLAPEDRRATGLITAMNLRENVTLPGIRGHSTLGLIRRRSERATSAAQVQSLRIKTPSIETAVRNLSGGTQQKVVLAKWLALKPKVIIFDEPTRGIDVGAKAEIYRLMRDLAGLGVAIIMISSDMEEVLGVSDRIAVMFEGRITGVLERRQFSEEAVMRMAVGSTIQQAAS